MDDPKRRWKTFKGFLRKFDILGESFTFRYKDEENHSTELGGIVCIVFYIFIFSYCVVNFIPFYEKKNFTLRYYSINLVDTQNISFLINNSSTAFAFGLTDGNNGTINDLFNINLSFVEREYGNENKKNSSISYRPCKEKDFNEIKNKQFYGLDIEKLQCLDSTDFSNESPKGIYTDNNFSYYTLTVEAKYPNNKTHQKLIYNYLIKFDCKLQFYYKDIIINVTKENDIYSYILNSMFIQLDPTLFKRKNIFFMNYTFEDDNNLLHFIKPTVKIENRTGISRVEDYALYKGTDKLYKEQKDFDLYARMYLRVDNRKVVISRRYQDFMEFYADSTSLLLSIFWVLGVFFTYFDRIKANHSISKKLFFFEGIKKNKFKEFKELKDIIKTKGMNINNEQNPILHHIRTIKENPPISNENISINNYMRRNTTSELNSNPDENIEANKELIDYSSYHIYEMIGSFDLFKCKSKKYQGKINLIKQANKIIDEKLDIVYYIRKMILYEKIYSIYLENKEIINFLSRPIIYLNNKKEKKPNIETNEIRTNATSENSGANEKQDSEEKKYIKLKPGEYKTEYILNSKELNKAIENLVLNPNKTENQKELIKFVKKQLKGV